MIRTTSSLVLAVVVALAASSCVVAQDEDPVYRCEAVDLTSASLEVQDVTISEIQSDVDVDGSTSDSENCFPTNFPDTVIVRTSGIVTGVGRTDPPMFYMQDGTGTKSALSIHIPHIHSLSLCVCLFLMCALMTYTYGRYGICMIGWMETLMRISLLMGITHKNHKTTHQHT